MNEELSQIEVSSTVTALEREYFLKEYEVHTNFIIESQTRIVTIYLAAIGLAMAILGGAAKFVYDSKFAAGSEILAYVTLFPGLISCVALVLIGAQRAAIAHTAAYIIVGIERRLGVAGFESKLKLLRSNRGHRREANDPIALALGIILGSSLFVFVYSICKIVSPSWQTKLTWHLIAPAELVAFFWWSSRGFLKVVEVTLDQAVSSWEQVLKQEVPENESPPEDVQPSNEEVAPTVPIPDSSRGVKVG